MLNLVAKGEFAKRVNLSPGRVSQLISEGKIADCLVGEGRNQKINFDKAVAALKIRRDPGQALGNGAKAVLATPPAAPLSPTDDLAVKLQRAKLEEAEFRNRKSREEERARAGMYVLADDVRAETAKLATRMLHLYEGGLADVATDIAGAFKIPQRDVLHMLRTKFRDVRTNVSAQLATEAAAMPATMTEPEPQDA